MVKDRDTHDKDESKAAEREAGHKPPTREDLNDTGHGMPLTLGGGGYGGTDKTVETGNPAGSDKPEKDSREKSE